MPSPSCSDPPPPASVHTSLICYIVDALSALYALSFSFYPGNGLVRAKKLHDVLQNQVE